MTAGSIELFPIRVPPMGNAKFAFVLNVNTRETQRVCRNLFGRVEPGSAEAERRQEEQNKLEEWKKRYDIDLTANPRALPEEQLNSTKLPSLIEQEMKEYEKRLALLSKQNQNDENVDDNVKDQDKDNEMEKCNLTAEKLRENAETTPQPHRSTGINSINLNSNGYKHRNHSNDGNLGNQNIRSQPYVRQKLISECFTTRRKPMTQHSVSERQKHWPDLLKESAASGALLLNTTPTTPTTTITTTESVSSSIQQQKKT